MFDDKCELCQLCQGNIKTKLYFDSPKVIIVNCATCRNVPLLVWKDHTMVLSQEDLEHILSILKKEFPNYKIRMNQRLLKSHLHWHLLTS